MSEFQKGLLLGIMLMGSMFLFTAQTKTKMDKKIIEYFYVEERHVQKAIEQMHLQPYGSPLFDGYQKWQAMVKYE